MINVYVWLPKTIDNRKNVGHASMLVSGHTYVSWWPAEDADLGRDYNPIRNKSYASDVADERCAPDSNTQINGLNERAIFSNSRPSECDSSWFAHFDSDKMMRHHRDVEKDLRYGLLEPEPARFWRSSACFGS